jgi:hypothetical protein
MRNIHHRTFSFLRVERNVKVHKRVFGTRNPSTIISYVVAIHQNVHDNGKRLVACQQRSAAGSGHQPDEQVKTKEKCIHVFHKRYTHIRPRSNQIINILDMHVGKPECSRTFFELLSS